MKNKFILLFILASLLVDFTAVYIITQTLRVLYARNPNEYTILKKSMDMLSYRLDTIPVLFWISLGIAIGIIFVCCWGWYDEELFKK